MTPREVFGIVLRTFGLIGLFYWLSTFAGAVATGDKLLMMGSFLVSVLAGYLLRGAPVLLEFAYPSTRESRWREEHARFSKGAERISE
jgi:hypothetical protein